MSRREIREYDNDSRRIPVLMTFCLRRTMRVYVLSASNWEAYFERELWNCDSEPARTATHVVEERKYEKIYETL